MLLKNQRWLLESAFVDELIPCVETFLRIIMVFIFIFFLSQLWPLNFLMPLNLLYLQILSDVV